MKHRKNANSAGSASTDTDGRGLCDTNNTSSTPSKYAKDNKSTNQQRSPINTIFLALIFISQVLLFSYLLLSTKILSKSSSGWGLGSPSSHVQDSFSPRSNGYTRKEGGGASSFNSRSGLLKKKKRIASHDHEGVAFSSGTASDEAAGSDSAQLNLNNMDSIMQYQPFSALLANNRIPTNNMDHPGYGEHPLTGVYTLGKDHLLQDTSANSAVQEMDVGTIHFPIVDLSDLLEEETPGPNRMGVGGERNILIPGNRDYKSVIPSSLLATNDDDSAIVTRRGRKMGDVPNQDRSFICRLYVDMNKETNGDLRGSRFQVENQRQQQQEEQAKNKDRPSALLMGIFDGHGNRGHDVSHFIALQFTKMFASIMRDTQSMQGPYYPKVEQDFAGGAATHYIEGAFTQTFLHIDAGEPVKGTAGSTASVVFYPGEGLQVYIANVGDSTTVIAKYSKSQRQSTIVKMNRKHKPHLEEERDRIEEMGGQVMIPNSALDDNGPGLKESSRVVIPDMQGNAWGGLALAMSRSIGDYDGKRVGLIASPDVDVFDAQNYYVQMRSQQEFDDTEWFAITASDGLYDVLTVELVANYLGRALFSREGPGGVGVESTMSVLEACERLIREASRLWAQASYGGVTYRDDITVAVSKLNLPKRSVSFGNIPQEDMFNRP